MVDVLKESGALSVKAGSIASPTTRDSLSGQEMMRPYEALAKAVGHVGETLQQAALPYEQEAGVNSVQRDAEGNIQVGRRLEFTAGDRAYNAAALQAGLAMGKTQINEQFTKLRLDFDGRPDEFKRASDEMVRNVGRGGDSRLRTLLQQEAASVASQHFMGLMSSKHNIDMQRSLNALTAREKLLTDQADSMVSQGLTGTPEFQRTRAEIDDIRQQKVNNPKWAYSPEQKAAEDAVLDNDLRGKAIVGAAKRDYESHGDLARAQKWADEQLSGLKISTEDRLRYLGQVGSRLQGAHAARTQERDAVRQDAALVEVAFQQGQSVDTQRFEAVRASALRLRDYGTVAKIEQAKLWAEYEPLIRHGTPAQAAGVLSQMQQRAGAIKVSGEGDGSDVGGRLEAKFRQQGWPPIAAAALAGQVIAESRGNTSAVNPGDGRDGSDSIGIFQWNSDRARQLKAFAASRGTSVIDEDTQVAFASHELQTTEKRWGNQLRSAGDVRSASRAVISYLRPAGWKEDNPEAGHNFQHRFEEAQKIAARDGGTRAQASLAEHPLGKQLLQKTATIINERARDTWKGMEEALDKGFQPSAEEWDALKTFLPQVTDPKLRADISQRAKVEEGKAQTDGKPVAEIERMVAMGREAAGNGDLNLVQRQINAAQAKAAEQRRTVITEEPVKYGSVDRSLGLPVPSPLNLQSAEGFATSLSERQRLLAQVRNVEGTAPNLIFTKQDRAQMSGTILNGDANASAMVLQGLSSLPPEVMAAEFAQKDTRDAISGLTRSGDPAKMRAGFEALGALQRRNPAAFAKVFSGDVENRLEAWNARTAYLPADEAIKQMMSYDDPATVKAREAAREEGEKKVKTVTPAMVTGYFAQGFVQNIPGVGRLFSPSAPIGEMNGVQMPDVLTAQYKTIFAEAYAATKDDGRAREIAIKRLSREWQPSVLNGGALTRHAPEVYYPKVNGSHDWMKVQLDANIVQAMSTVAAGGNSDRAIAARGEASRSQAQAATALPRMIVPDTKTEDAARAGRPPTYAVVVRYPDGRHDVLHDLQNQPIRFRPDPVAAQATAREGFTDERAYRDAARIKMDPRHYRGG